MDDIKGAKAAVTRVIEDHADDRNMRWQMPPVVDEDAVQELTARTRDLPYLANRLLWQRGFTDTEKARSFLEPSLASLHDPSRMKGMDQIVDALIAARSRGDVVGIHGDYDVDGLSSTALLTRVLRSLDFVVDPFVPDRMIDGYGVARRALDTWHHDGVKTVLTCDTGIKAHAEIEYAVDTLGMTVLVTDHHHAEETLPKAHVIVNPQQHGCPYPQKSLCGAGVAYKVLEALVRRLGLDVAAFLHPHMDLVALGTVADVVPLVDENRVFVHHGVRRLRVTDNPGLQALYAAADIKKINEIDETTIGFIIAPHLNAIGRIEAAEKGLELLLTDDDARAEDLATEIHQVNVKRQAITKAIEESAHLMIKSLDMDETYGIVLWGPRPGETAPWMDPNLPCPEWHHGVLGIVAARIVERYGRPCFLLAYDDGSGRFKGSGRAPERGNIHLYEALVDCDAGGHLHRFGGHAGAAGATIAGVSLEERQAFASAFNEAMRRQMQPEDRISIVKADLPATIADCTPKLYRWLRRFAPFGRGNEPMRLLIRDAQITSTKALGAERGTLKCTLAQPGTQGIEAIAFGMVKRFPELMMRKPPFRVDVVAELTVNTFNDRTTLQLRIDDLVMLDPPKQTISNVPSPTLRPVQDAPAPRTHRPAETAQPDLLEFDSGGIMDLFGPGASLERRTDEELLTPEISVPAGQDTGIPRSATGTAATKRTAPESASTRRTKARTHPAQAAGISDVDTNAGIVGSETGAPVPRSSQKDSSGVGARMADTTSKPRTGPKKRVDPKRLFSGL